MEDIVLTRHTLVSTTRAHVNVKFSNARHSVSKEGKSELVTTNGDRLGTLF